MKVNWLRLNSANSFWECGGIGRRAGLKIYRKYLYSSEQYILAIGQKPVAFLIYKLSTFV